MNASRTERIVMASSALSFGLLGWCLAHGLTYWLLTHQHVVSTGETIRHSHNYLPAAALAAACAAAGSLLAVFVVSWRTKAAPHQTRWRRDMRRAAALSTSAYLAGELAEHQLTGDHQLPGPLVALIGACVYLLAAAVTTVVWRGSATAMRAIAVRLSASPHRLTRIPRPVPIAAWLQAPRSRPWQQVHFGRAPPVLPA